MISLLRTSYELLPLFFIHLQSIHHMDFYLENQEFIELNKLLKLMGLVDTGGEAKQVIEMGQVKVNEQVEFRKRNKLRSGDMVEFAGKTVKVL